MRTKCLCAETSMALTGTKTTRTARTRQRSASLRVMTSSRRPSQVVSIRWSTGWVMEVGTGSKWNTGSWRFPTWVLLAQNPAMWWTSTIMTNVTSIISGSQKTSTCLIQMEWTFDTSLIIIARKVQCAVCRRAAQEQKLYSGPWEKIFTQFIFQHSYVVVVCNSQTVQSPIWTHVFATPED